MTKLLVAYRNFAKAPKNRNITKTSITHKILVYDIWGGV